MKVSITPLLLTIITVAELHYSQGMVASMFLWIGYGIYRMETRD